MHKLALVTAISSSVMVSAVSAEPLFYYGFAQSGTLADPLAGFSVATFVPTTTSYVSASSGTVSNRTTPAIQLTVGSQWSFDFSDPAAVSFTGILAMGDLTVQTNMGSPLNIDGRQSSHGVTYSFSGVGQYDLATRIFTYSFMNPAVNGGGASVYSSTGYSTCSNGATSVLGKVCESFNSTSPNWEGLTLNFVFDEYHSQFFGILQGIQTSGSGFTRNTTTVNWMVSSPAPMIPVPAAAWLFGSALLGLAGSRRRGRRG